MRALNRAFAWLILAVLILGGIWLTSPKAATANLTPTAVQHFDDNNGNPCSGCKVFTYLAGTTTKVDTYVDSSETTQNTDPIILNTRGEANIWLDNATTYKFVLAPATDTDPPTNAIWTVDNIPGSQANSISLSSLPSMSSGSLVGNCTGSTTTPQACTASALLDQAFGSSRGSIIYRGATTWALLSPGTSGNFLETLGAGANPTWASAALPAQANNTLLGNNTGGSAAPIALTATQATAILNAMVGDSGSGGTKGLVPAPATGDGAAGKTLHADGTWSTGGTVPIMFYATISGTVATVNGSGVTSMVYSGSNALWNITLSAARPSVNYSVVCMAEQGTGGAEGVQEPSSAFRSTTAFQLQFYDTSPGFHQPTAVSCMVGGG